MQVKTYPPKKNTMDRYLRSQGRLHLDMLHFLIEDKEINN